MAKSGHTLPILPPWKRVPIKGPPLPTWPPVTPSPGTVNGVVKYARIGGAAAVGKALPIIYGRQRVEGRVFYYQPYLPTGSPVYVGVTIGVGEIEEVTTVRVNGFPLPPGGIDGLSYVTYLGTSAGNADSGVYATVNSNFYSTWKFPGVAYAVFTIDPRAVPFETIESFAFDVKGLKVKDFRTDTTAYSANAALCLWDFLTNTRHGCKRPETLMDDADASSSWWVAADLCDEVVDSEARYELNIAITEQATAESLLEVLRAHCAADVFFQKGLWRCVIESEREPVLAFDDSSNCRDVTISTLPSADKPTSVTITFPNPDKEYDEDVARFPEAAVTGLQLAEASYSLQGCRAKQAKRLAAIYQRKGQFEEYLADFVAGPEAVSLLRRDIVTLTTQDGLAAQEFDILDMEQLDTGEYRISAREHDPAAYSDDAQATDTLPNVDYGNPWDPPARVNAIQTASGVTYAFDTEVWFEGPRRYTETQYGASYWSALNLGTVTAAAINDGVKTVTAVDFYNAGGSPLDQKLILDLGAGNTARMGAVKVWCAEAAYEQFPVAQTGLYYSDDGSSWTRISICNYDEELYLEPSGPGPAWTRFEWGDVGAHRFWAIGNIGTTAISTRAAEVQFEEITGSGADFLDHVEVRRVVEATNPYNGYKYEAGDLLLTIPAHSLPSATAPLDLSPWVVYTAASGWTVRDLKVMFVTVSTIGNRNSTNELNDGLVYIRSWGTTDPSSAHTIRQTGSAPTKVQTGSDALDGTRKGADIHATRRLLLDSAPSAPVSGAGQIALRDNAGALEASVNGGAYAALGGGALTVKESDGSPSVANVTEIRVDGATVTDEGGGAVTIGITGGAGSLQFTPQHDYFEGDGVETDFTLTNPAGGTTAAYLLLVTLNGADDTASWSFSGTGTIVRSSAVPDGDQVHAITLAALGTTAGVQIDTDTGDGSTTDFPVTGTPLALLYAVRQNAFADGCVLVNVAGTIYCRYPSAPPDGDALAYATLQS